MQQIFTTAFAAALVLIGSYLVPWAARYPTLLGKNRDWSPDTQYRQIKDTCKALYPLQLQGCEKFKVIGDDLFAACVGDWDVRRKWFPPMGVFENVPKPIRDNIFKLDLKTKALIRLDIPDFPTDADFCLHGMDIVEVTPGEFSIFLVNHRRDGSVVEKFNYKRGGTDLFYKATFNGSHRGLRNPNDIFAIPISELSPVTEDAFFVTNDYYFRGSKLGRLLETYLRLPTGTVFYHSTSTGIRQIAKGFSNANGIAGFQDQEFRASNSRLANTVFITSILNGVIIAYRYEPGRVLQRDGFTKLKEFSFDFVMDNLAISQDSKWLYLTGHGEPSNLDSHWRSPEKVPSAAMSYRMSLTELGDYFGNQGEIGESRVEKIVVDKFGKMGNASTIAVGDDEMNRYWMSGLTFKGIIECDLRVNNIGSAGGELESEEVEDEDTTDSV